jgi:hypothetical protein
MNHPLESFVVISKQLLIVELRDGTLWHVTADANPRPVTQKYAAEHLAQLSADKHWMATSTTNGEVVIYDTLNWRPDVVFRGSGAVRQIAISPQGDTIAIAMRSGHVHLGRRRTNTAGWGDIEWIRIGARARYMRYDPRGTLLTITNNDGAILFYSTTLEQWYHFQSGTAGLTVVRTNSKGSMASTVDSMGRLLLIRLDAAREQLEASR